jgi:hypothetical protein
MFICRAMDGSPEAAARVLGALDCEFLVIPAAMPTLEELGDLFE